MREKRRMRKRRKKRKERRRKNTCNEKKKIQMKKDEMIKAYLVCISLPLEEGDAYEWVPWCEGLLWYDEG